MTGLGERGIGFQSLTEAIDTTTSAGRLLFGILALAGCPPAWPQPDAERPP